MLTIGANGAQANLSVRDIGYGISQSIFRPNSMYFHGGEMPGDNWRMGDDPVNDITLVIWTNLTLSHGRQPTAKPVMLKMLDPIYTDCWFSRGEGNVRLGHDKSSRWLS
jgi:hypothetical protein